MPGISMLLQRRVYFRQEILDLTSILSVQQLSKRLRETTPKIDVVICNAGIGGWEDLYWGRAVWTVLTRWKSAVTWPTFKKSGVGWVTKPQVPPVEDGKKVEEPSLGEVFTANLFGHYLLGHYLAPLLWRAGADGQRKGRLIWVSSLEAYSHSFDINEMQSIKSTQPYESSKRQTDLMGITSVLPSTTPLVNQYLSSPAKNASTEVNLSTPRIYVAHPGICGTAIFPLPLILEYCMLFVFYMARWLGSMWHPVTSYKGACAMVWLALADESTLDKMEAREGVGKWGSACDIWGNERVERTEVEGWGWGGRLEDVDEGKRRKGRSPYAKDLTTQDKEKFVETGRRCWEEMESLRLEWEERLEDAGVGIKLD